MNPQDSVAGGPKFFGTTLWSAIRDAQEMSREDRALALDRLISVYWRPVYWTFRMDWNADRDAAKDLTQEFFAMFLEQDMVDKLDRDRGRFRSYVKTAIKHFMISHKRAENAAKRGGGRRIVGLEDLNRVEAESAAKAEPPEARFDRELMRSILQQALDDLERHCAELQRSDDFELFRTYYMEESKGNTLKYEDLQKQFQIGMHAVKHRLADLRTRYKEYIFSYLRDGVTTEEELESEIRDVFGG